MANLWVHGGIGSGLPLASLGKLPLAHATTECPCDIEVFTALEGPQIVTDFDYPRAASVSGPNGFNVLKIVRQIAHYPYDLEDGRLVFEAENSAGTPFPTTATAAPEVIHDNCDGITAIYGTALVTPADLSELAIDGPVQPLSVTVRWNDGVARTMVDDGLGNLTGPFGSGTINYCTRIIALTLTGTVPAAATDITIDYTAMDNEQVSTLNTGTVSGGRYSVAGTVVNYSLWNGWISGTNYDVVAGSFDMAGQPADTYWIVIDSTGAASRVTTITIGDELLCKLTWSGAAITGGPWDTRMMLNEVNATTHECLDFYYYAMWVYDNVSLTWHRCSPTDYSLAYYSNRMVDWIWQHLPPGWEADDGKTLQVLMPQALATDGQVVNLHEPAARLRGELYRFLKWFSLQGEKSRSYIRAITLLYVDPDKCPEEWLHTMASMLDFSLPRVWDVMRKRYHVKQCTATYKEKGTIEGILGAAYRVSGIVPTYTYAYDNIIYTDAVATTMDTTIGPAVMETAADTNYYVRGISRESHYHERGLNLFFTDPMHSLLGTQTRDLLRDVNAGSGPTYTTNNAVTANRLTPDMLFQLDYIQPGSLTINWTDTGAVARSMIDDSVGGFLAAGDGDPANSSVDYKTGYITLKTVAVGINHLPQTNSDITCTFTSTSRGMFNNMREEIRRYAGATVHVAYFINGELLAESEN